MTTQKTAIWLKLAITATFVLGALVFIYPFVANAINTQIDKYRIEEVEKKTLLDREEQLAKKEAREEEIKNNPHLGMKLEDEIFNEVESSSQLSSKDIKNHLIGSISIPKINSELPIFDTTSSSFLQEGVTLLPGASYPTGGEGTHSVLTGHTGLPNKKLFTDLKDVTKGDIFYIKVLGETIAYKVDQIKVVLPDELEDLKVVEGMDYVTLITCTPYMINTHRLLVRGERTEIDYQTVEQAKKNSYRKNNLKLIFFAVIIISLIGLVIFVGYRQFVNYQIMKKSYKIDFRLLKNRKSQKNIPFIVLDSSKRHPIMKDDKELIIISDDKGRIRLGDLNGGNYWLKQHNVPVNPVEIKCWVKTFKDELFEVKLANHISKEWSIKLRKRKRK